MLGSEGGEKNQLPPPQEEEKEVMQAKTQTEKETMVLQGYAMPIPPWMGYGHFSTVYGRCTKAEFAEEFYA